MAAEWLASTDRRGRAHLVHRLDRRVSGLLLIARSTKAASRLSQSFAKRDVLKTYLALCNRTAHAPALATGTPYPYPYPYPYAYPYLYSHAPALASGAEGRVAATLRFDPRQMRAVPVPEAAAGGGGVRRVSLGYAPCGL